VQVPCDEGVAIHIGPEPCADVRKGAGEASAGECTGVNKRPRLTPPWLDRSIAWLADRRRDPTPINTGALLHRVEMRLRGLQVGSFEAFAEAIIHRLQQAACRGGTALILL
jgi:hypothetical protein